MASQVHTTLDDRAVNLAHGALLRTKALLEDCQEQVQSMLESMRLKTQHSAKDNDRMINLQHLVSLGSKLSFAMAAVNVEIETLGRTHDTIVRAKQLATGDLSNTTTPASRDLPEQASVSVMPFPAREMLPEYREQQKVILEEYSLLDHLEDYYKLQHAFMSEESSEDRVASPANLPWPKTKETASEVDTSESTFALSLLALSG